MSLNTTFLGMELKNPLVPSASPLSHSIDMVKRLEDAGASALIMFSMFEEELTQELDTVETLLHHQSLGHGEASSFFPSMGDMPPRVERYTDHLRRIKEAVDIPVIASLNGSTPESWIENVRLLEQAGADAIELNIYYLPLDIEEDGTEVEQRYIELLSLLKEQITVPINVKLSFHFSAIPNMVKALENAGADGVSLFNRLYMPDIDVDSMQVAPKLHLSRSADALLAMHWISILFGKTRLSLGATSGIHTADDAIKFLLAGADVTHVCSSLLVHGPEYLAVLLTGIENWLEESPFETLEQFKGNLSHLHMDMNAQMERCGYIKTLDSFSLPTRHWR